MNKPVWGFRGNSCLVFLMFDARVLILFVMTGVVGLYLICGVKEVTLCSNSLVQLCFLFLCGLTNLDCSKFIVVI